MNLPNKITLSRIILTIFIILLLVFPFEEAGIKLPQLFINEMIVVDIKYPIAGVLFIVAALTDMIDGKLARKNNQVTDLGKMLDAIADKVLVNSVLIIFAAQGFINVFIPVVIVIRDIVVDAIKMEAASKGRVVAAIKSGKIKTASLMIGLVLTFIYNLPFEIWNIRVSDFMLYFASIMSILSAIEYYKLNKNIIFPKEEIIE